MNQAVASTDPGAALADADPADHGRRAPGHVLARILAPLYRRRRRALALALALSIVTAAAGVALLGVSGWFLTAAALAGPAAAFNLFAPSALVRGLSFVRILARYGERLAGHAATLSLLADLRARVFAGLLPKDPGGLASLRDGDVVSRLTGDVDALDTVYLMILAPALTALAAAALLAAALHGWLPGSAWAPVAALVAAAVAVPAWLARRAAGPGRQAQEAAAQLRAEALQAVEGHGDLLALGAASAAAARFGQAAAQAGRARMCQAAAGGAGQAAVQLLAGISMLAVLVAGVPAVRDGTLHGAVLAGLLLAVLAAFEAAGAAARGASKWGSAVAAAERLQALQDMPAAVPQACRPAAVPGTGTLAFESVRFGYGAAPVLDGVDLRIAPGERVAIVGASGAGKSTLLRLLVRMADPQSGAVRYGGVDLRDMPLDQWHRRVALAGQDAPVFLGTVRSNLLIGNPQADDAAMWRALQAAQLADFVRSLPDGLDTWTGETGRSLSAGQARRLCLARALLAPAAILALDEPTHGLDDETAWALLAGLGRAAQGRAVLLVTHAALPAGAVDRVLRLEGGRLLPV